QGPRQVRPHGRRGDPGRRPQSGRGAGARRAGLALPSVLARSDAGAARSRGARGAPRPLGGSAPDPAVGISPRPSRRRVTSARRLAVELTLVLAVALAAVLARAGPS